MYNKLNNDPLFQASIIGHLNTTVDNTKGGNVHNVIVHTA